MWVLLVLRKVAIMLLIVKSHNGRQYLMYSEDKLTILFLLLVFYDCFDLCPDQQWHFNNLTFVKMMVGCVITVNNGTDNKWLSCPNNTVICM